MALNSISNLREYNISIYKSELRRRISFIFISLQIIFKRNDYTMTISRYRMENNMTIFRSILPAAVRSGLREARIVGEKYLFFSAPHPMRTRQDLYIYRTRETIKIALK